MPHELPPDLRFRVLVNKEISEKCQNSIELSASALSSPWNKKLVSTSKNLIKNRNWTLTVVRCFTWKLELVSNILWMIVWYFEYVKFDGDVYFYFDITGLFSQRFTSRDLISVAFLPFFETSNYCIRNLFLV